MAVVIVNKIQQAKIMLQFVVGQAVYFHRVSSLLVGNIAFSASFIITLCLDFLICVLALCQFSSTCSCSKVAINIWYWLNICVSLLVDEPWTLCAHKTYITVVVVVLPPFPHVLPSRRSISTPPALPPLAPAHLPLSPSRPPSCPLLEIVGVGEQNNAK